MGCRDHISASMRRIVTGDLGADRADSSYGSLAVSAINGSGACMDAHEKMLREAGVGSAGGYRTDDDHAGSTCRTLAAPQKTFAISRSCAQCLGQPSDDGIV
ncbi:carboxymuconolactone decarboxylase family protein [Bradyrhizobium sp. 200]|nr:carboxymuconolactone decarboxylase family protein [Bradyrhizobium sp. 200]